MSRQSLLARLHRDLQPVVDRLHLRPLAQRVFQFLYRRRHPAGSLVRTVKNGRELFVDAELALHGEGSEPATIEWLRCHLNEGDCAFDIGANIGEMTLEMACLVGPAGRVVSVEPAPGNLAILRSQVRRNGFNGFVDVLAAAAGDGEAAEASLVVFGDAQGANALNNILPADRQHPNYEKLGRTTVTVPLISVDGYCREHGLRPKVLKIDVEGGELSVLRGCRRVLAECGPAVYFAFHPWGFADVAAASREIRELFAAAGYRLEPGDDGGPLEFREYSAVRGVTEKPSYERA